MDLWLPTSASRVQEEARHQYAAALVRDLHDRLERWNRELKQIDINLELVKAQDDAQHPALKPGYYHVIRHNPGSAPGVIIVQGPNGEFREPDSGLFRELKEGDLWNDNVRTDRRRRARAIEKAEQRQQERERQERVDDFHERLRSMRGTSIRVPRSV